MSNLNSPSVNVTFTELGISAIARGDKGIVALIIRESKAGDVLVLAQASEIPTTLAKANQEYIARAFIGYVNPPKRVIVITTGADDENLAEALELAAVQDFDYLAGPPDCTAAEAAAIASWIRSERTNNGAKYKAVLPNTASDHYAIVNFAAEAMQAGETTHTAAQYCSRIAGLLAGTPMTISATYAPLPELSDVVRLTKEQRDAAVNAGKLIPIWDGRKVKLSRAVTSLVTTSQGMQDSFKKIKIVEIMDLIRTDITQTAEDEYIGKFANGYDNKLLLVTAISGYLDGLRLDGLIQPGYTVGIDVEQQAAYLKSSGVDTDSMSEQEIKEADTGSHVFLKVACKILDAIEDIDVNIEI